MSQDAELPAVSIVVPTRDRPESLARCLAALDRQREVGGPTGERRGNAVADADTDANATASAASTASVEIVVVDDQSGDPGAVRRAVDSVARARLVRGGGAGPAAARNLGASAARGAIVCFTDDDCEPDPGWASTLAAAIAGGADAAAGLTTNADSSDRLAEASQHIANYLGEHSRGGDAPFAASNNLACRVDLAREIRFDESYPLAAGEDRAWCAELAARGCTLAYEPAALARHRQELTAGTFWRQHSRYGRGAYRFGRDSAGALPSPAALYPRLLARGFRLGLLVGALVCVAQVATAVGYLRAALAERRRA